MQNLAGKIVTDVDRRSAERHVVNDEAVTFFKGSRKAISCAVRDVSDTGARLKIEIGTFLPRRFKLYIPEKHILADCEMVWRKRSEIGLQFRSVTSID